jgi:eukaryotic-like serine/threonine-protein kinase
MTDSIAASRHRLYQLFDQALDMQAAARAAFLEKIAAEDPRLRAEVEALIAVAVNDQQSTGALLSGGYPAEELIGREFGRFRLVELIGAGGMGIVFRAERTDGVQQSVAVKLLASQLALAGQARFQREAQLLARLEHPAVARLIDAGVESGRGWIALEFIQGRPIDEYCAANHLTIRARVRLLVQLVDAVSAAHRMLVVHRDIKPANVLVNPDGMPKLIDFGIAAALIDAGAAHPPTMDIGRLFTPNYAAPEQVKGDPVTVVTDVYGLGALGYRLLTGRVPYAEATGAIEYALAINRRDVEPPSRTALAAGSEFREVQQLRGDLDAILQKALDRDPERRYASAADLRADLLRYLDDLPVVARAPSALYRLRKFTRRNTLAVGLGSALAVGLLAGALMYARQTRTVAEARSMAARRGEFLETMLKSADPHWGSKDITVAQLLDKAAQQLDRQLSQEPLVEASMLGLVAGTYEGLGRFAEALDASTRQLALLRLYDGSPVDVATALTTRGELLIESGRTVEAEAPLREAVALLSGRRGATKSLAASLTQLGIVLTNTGREKEAEATYHSAIDFYRKEGEPLALNAGYPLGNLSVLLGNEGRYAEAAATALDAMTTLKRILPADHPDLLAVQMNYASTLANLHQASAAEPLFRELIAARTRVLGAEHKDTLIAQYELADDLAEQHRDAEAADVSRPVAETLARTLGSDNPWTLATWGVYGNAACRSGQGEEGLQALRRVQESRIKVYGATDWHTLSTDLSIGNCVAAMQRYAEAEPMLLNTVAALEKERGPNFHRTQSGYQSLVDLYVASGRSADAERWKGKLLPP